MKTFTPEWLESGCPPVPEYEAYIGTIRLPDAIDGAFSLHDARILRIAYAEKGFDRGDVRLFLDTRQSATKAKELFFPFARLTLTGTVEGTWWIAEEFSTVRDGFRMDVMTVDGKTDAYGFLTVEFRDMQLR